VFISRNAGVQWQTTLLSRLNAVCITALKIWEASLPSGHPNISITRSIIGRIYLELCKYEEALEHLTTVLEIRKKTLPPDHPDIAKAHDNIGAYYLTIGKYEEAKEERIAALDILGKTLPPDHPDIAHVHNNIGVVYSELCKYEEALVHYTTALMIKEQSLPPNHPDILHAHYNLCHLYYNLGDHNKTLEYAATLMQLTPPVYQTAIQTFSDIFRINLLRDLRKCPFLINTVAFTKQNKISEKSLYSILLQTKDVNAEAEFAIRASKLPERYPKYRETLVQLRDKRILQQQLELNNEPDNKEIILKLKQECRNLELFLAPYVKEINFKQHMETMTTETVLNKLPSGSAMIEYGWFDYEKSAADSQIDIKSGGRYYAFLLKDREISLHYFDENDDVIHSKIYEIRKILTDSENNLSPSDVDCKLSELYKILIAPFWDKLKSIKHLYIAPDGELYKLPFELLLDNSGNTLASDAVSVSYLSSGRDLVRPEESKHITGYTSAAILADPLFDLPGGYKKTIVDDDSGNRGIVSSRSRDLGKFKGFAPIPYTKVEADAVDKVFVGSKIIKYGLEAKKNTLSKIGSPNILHIAIHGFALEKQELTEDKLKMSLQGDLPHRQAEDPLIRCGLAFSGANDFLKSDGKVLLKEYDDGILTAKDILSLDLPETDLLVLSACQTALGEVRNGEGIQGMRRAFELIGVSSLICTLWSVSDASSAVFMARFYTNLIDRKMDKPTALKEAKEHVKIMTNSELVKYLINNDITDEIKKKELDDFYSNATDAWKEERPYEHPYYWAGYILQGDTGRPNNG